MRHTLLASRHCGLCALGFPRRPRHPAPVRAAMIDIMLRRGRARPLRLPRRRAAAARAVLRRRRCFPDILAFGLYGAVVVGLAWPLAAFMHRVYAGERLRRCSRRWSAAPTGSPGSTRARQQHWTGYALAMLAFNLAGFALLYVVLRLQGVMPWNPEGLPPMAPDLAFNTAMSFVTNTNWQAYSGEAALSYFSQMAGPDGAELRLGRDRHGGRRRGVTRVRGALGEQPRQLLGRSDAVGPLRAAAAVDPPRPRAHRHGRAAVARALHAAPDARGRRAAHRPGAGGEPGGDQAARHQRRRLLQDQLGASAGEPDGRSRTCCSASRSC